MKIKDKIVEVGGKRYKLTKLNADAGSYVAFKLAGVALPLMSGMSGKGQIWVEVVRITVPGRRSER